ncbi:MAG: TRAP transporter large permease [Spongiibacteraceae bacterium]|nr:TRAP transporter large permease [Spongiibacteraceae bacterium]
MTVLVVGLVMMALMIATRIPLGFILLLCSIGGITATHPRGLSAAVTIAQNEYLALAMNYQFSVLPLFLVMGVFVAKAGLADDLFEAANCWLGRFRGGLGMATIASCAGFSSLSHNSAASTSIMGKIALPVLRKHGYEDGFSAGAVAAGGTLGLMIPPSGALIIYGLLTETNLDGLFMAALIPAGLQVLLYIAVIAAIAWFKPSWLPRGQSFSWQRRFSSLRAVWGVIALFLLIVVGIFFGWFTTTEAGGVGAGGALAFSIVRRRMTWKIFVDCLKDTAKTTAMIYFVASSAMVMNQFINLAGVPGDVVALIQEMNMTPILVVFTLLLFYLILGMFLDGFAMIFLTVPVIVPVILGLGMDPIWWGVITVIVVELALISPPVGMNCFILKATIPDIPLSSIYRGILPFFFSDIVRLVFLVLMPGVVLWLPSLIA